MMVLREVAQYVHCCGIRFSYYLDDWLICHCNPAVLSDHLQFLLDLGMRLGVARHLKKVRSGVQPTVYIIYLGMDFDTVLALV